MQVPIDRGERETFHFGRLSCRPVFARCYGVVPMTLQRYKKRIRGGHIARTDAIKNPRNKLNKNASQIDVVLLV
ncbi:hypothetical protein PC116_g15066 [Phytophthora cactorum]|nr:hypothetical protein PC116_g15066 [Phytophthora cactorum]